MKKGVRVLIILIIVLPVVAASGYFAYSRFGPGAAEGAGFKFPSFGGRQPGQGPNPGEKFTVPVAVTRAKSGLARQTLVLYGSVYAQKEVSIFTTVNGKISEIRVQEGDGVEKDQVLAVIDRDQAGLKFAPVEVKATIRGVVKAVQTQEGATVNPAAPLFQIVDMDVVEVVVNVPEKKIGQVRRGLPVEIAVVSYPDRLFYGRIDKLSPVVDPASRTLESRIRVTNPGYRLKPGMFAEARIVLQARENAVLLPLAALMDKEGQQVVFVVEEDRVREVKPRLAFIEGELAVVESGISAGDRIVVIGQQSLSHGDTVTVAEEKE